MATRLKTVLLNPGPSLTIPGETDSSPVYAEPFSQCGIGQVTSPDLTDCLFSENPEVSPTLHRVHLVLLSSPVTQMVDVDAGRVVTRMKHGKVGRPVVMRHDNPVSKSRLPFVSDPSVPLSVACPHEDQAVPFPFDTTHHFLVGGTLPGQNRLIQRFTLAPTHVVRRAHTPRKHISPTATRHCTRCVHSRRVQQWRHV